MLKLGECVIFLEHCGTFFGTFSGTFQNILEHFLKHIGTFWNCTDLITVKEFQVDHRQTDGQTLGLVELRLHG